MTKILTHTIRPGLQEFCIAYLALQKNRKCPFCKGRLWAEKQVHPSVVVISCDKGHSWEASDKEINDVERCLQTMPKVI